MSHHVKESPLHCRHPDPTQVGSFGGRQLGLIDHSARVGPQPSTRLDQRYRKHLPRTITAVEVRRAMPPKSGPTADRAVALDAAPLLQDALLHPRSVDGRGYE